MPMPKGSEVKDQVYLCTPRAETIKPTSEITVKKDWKDREWPQAQDPNNLTKYVVKKDD